MSSPPAHPDFEPLWLLRQGENNVVVLEDDGKGRQLICDPPLPAAMPPGFLVNLTDGESEFVVKLFPVPTNHDLLLGITEGWAFRSCSRLFEQIVDIIAHDLRNLVFSASLQAEIAQRQAKEPLPHVQTILAQLEKIQQYLERLLLYSRTPRLVPSRVNVESFVQERIRSARHRWPIDQPPRSFRVSVDPEAGIARWDPHLLGVTLDAVLENAMHATPQRGSVDVVVSGTAQLVTVEVSDQGPGIAPEVLPKVFVPMAARSTRGMGLGLVTARKLVEAHGGTLELHTSPRGTTVRLLLPREAPGA